MELQAAVERAKDNIEESVTRAKADRVDKVGMGERGVGEVVGYG